MPYPERYVLDTRVSPISVRQQLCPYTFYYVALCLCVAGYFSAKLEHCPLCDEGSFAEDFAFRVPVCMLSKAKSPSRSPSEVLAQVLLQLSLGCTMLIKAITSVSAISPSRLDSMAVVFSVPLAAQYQKSAICKVSNSWPQMTLFKAPCSHQLCYTTPSHSRMAFPVLA